MKVIALNGSPHASGTVAKGISVMAGELAKAGIETETITVGNMHMRGCTACNGCSKGNGCVIKGDSLNEIAGKIKEAGGIILGSPTYYGGIAGSFKCFLDRLFYSASGMMKHKVGATAVSLRRSGGISVFQQLNNYFNLAQVVLTPSIYWDVIHGNNPGEAEQDLEGMQIMEIQGRNMAWLIKALEAGSREVPPPADPSEKKWTNFIR